MFSFKLIVIFPILMVQVKCQHPDYVLPNNVRPLRYVITIHSFNTTNFKGSVEIELEALEETSNITLHAKNIEIDNNLVSITGENGKEVKWKDTSKEIEKDFFIINLNENLNKGKVYNLTINEYTGSLTEVKMGFFSGKHTDANGTERNFFITEFEPSYARKAFPCFDQPNLKAKFTMKIIRPSDLRSAFNTPLLETIDLGNGTQMDVFKETPVMPTYIVAFVVSDFEYTRPSDIVRILAPVEHTQGDSTNFVLEESVKILRAIEEYTGIKYPLDKIDMVAVPEHYYLDGAMENWGLIVYSDKYLVCPKTYSNIEIQKCLTFTAHEISHQWFGNLATQKAWNYMWLSEGFASYFQYYISDVVKPSWRIMEQYVLDEYEVSLKFDRDFTIDFVYTSPNSFPDPNAFYRKASAVIRMVQHILTDEIHRNGLRIYLQNNKFKNTEPIDLYNSYQQAVEDANATHLLGNSSIHEILSSWVKNPGYPLVTVTRDYDSGKVTFSQKSFNTNYGQEVLWYVPITYVLESSNEHFDFNKTTADVWLTQENITIDLGTNDGWILVNKHAIGYYRVNYDERNWERLTSYLRSKNYEKIPPVNRATLLYDAYTLTKESHIQYETFFNLTLYMEQEIDYIPISAFIDILEEEAVVRWGQCEFYPIKKYLAKLFGIIYKRIESTPRDNDTHIDGLRRTLLQKIMCAIDQDDCVKRALDVFASWRNTGELDINTDLKQIYLCAAMKGAQESSWEFLLQRYYLSNNMTLRRTYIYALNCVKDASLLQRFLKIVFDLNDPMHLEDKVEGLQQIVGTQVGANLVMDYILSVQLDDRLCTYFSGARTVFIPTTPNQREKMNKIKEKIGECLPISFYTKYDDNFAGSLSKWCEKHVPQLSEEFSPLILSTFFFSFKQM